MKSNRNLLGRESFIFSIISVFLWSQACQPSQQRESSIAVDEKPQVNVLVGQWQAEWQTSIDENMHSMQGELQFNEDGKVSVKAYGYQGCYFMSDTSNNEMAWQISGDTLHLLVPDDNFAFAYRIKDLSSDDVHLTLLEDINLHLRRN